ncbi:MerR family transcriptional regulator [Paenibacillus segetis]|uniref:HTH merR-type domain-containing protein n=1 Tax=Paenibacillus segetis TaxID=1325360 RepID=A0ABQ1YGK3_9BACL|nr:MerR family transcriptional regulator [Paenibacillus segetis]GGH23583.1 hypothetical protein GCM10008013_22800 [Paenibacillus segetis]
MNEYITISELSKLMSVSVHQIRYFEEMGVLYPAYTDTNQYRMYGIPEIYQLSHVLLLRKLNIPVGQIKESVMSYSTEDYRGLLKSSLIDIESEIDRLIHLKQFIQRTLFEHNETQHDPFGDYEFKYLNTRFMNQWIKFGLEEPINARNLYDNRGHLTNLFESDLHYLYREENVTLCFEANELTSVCLEEGKYLTKRFLVTEEDDILREIDKLREVQKECQYTFIGETILIERSYLSMFSNHDLLYEIQVKVGVE